MCLTTAPPAAYSVIRRFALTRTSVVCAAFRLLAGWLLTMAGSRGLSVLVMKAVCRWRTVGWVRLASPRLSTVLRCSVLSILFIVIFSSLYSALSFTLIRSTVRIPYLIIEYSANRIQSQIYSCILCNKRIAQLNALVICIIIFSIDYSIRLV